MGRIAARVSMLPLRCPTGDMANPGSFSASSLGAGRHGNRTRRATARAPRRRRRARSSTYSRVVVNYLRHKAGRGSLEESFANDRREERTIGREVAATTQGIPANEAVLVFTFPTLAAAPSAMGGALGRGLRWV